MRIFKDKPERLHLEIYEVGRALEISRSLADRARDEVKKYEDRVAHLEEQQAKLKVRLAEAEGH